MSSDGSGAPTAAVAEAASGAAADIDSTTDAATTAAAPAATAGTSVRGTDSSATPTSDDSYSATELKTGNPAEAASARVAESPDTIDRRFSWVRASRDSRRKLIRDVATREP